MIIANYGLKLSFATFLDVVATVNVLQKVTMTYNLWKLELYILHDY